MISKYISKAIAIVSACCAITSCDSESNKQSAENLRHWMEPNGKLKILATTAMIEDIVKQIGGDKVDTLTLIQGELDPHSYQLVKGDDEKLAYAQIIFSNGLGLEHGPSLRSYLEGNDKTVALGDKIRSENPNLVLFYNGSLDPHIWMDITIWEKIIPHVIKKLADSNPDHAKFFMENGKKVQSELRKKHNELKNKMAQVPQEKRYLITSHDAFNYFARAYLASENEVKQNNWQKRFAAPEGLAPESQLSSTDIKDILDHVQEYNVHVIFPEASVSQSSIRKLTNAGEEKGLNLCIVPVPLYSDTLGPPGSSGDTYLKMVEHNVDTMIKFFLKDNCDE